MNEQNPYESPSADGIRGSCVSDTVVEFDYTLEDAFEFSMHENEANVATSIRQRKLVLTAAASIFTIFALGMFVITTFSPIVLVFALMAAFFWFRTFMAKSQVNKAVRKVLTEMLGRRKSTGIFGRNEVTLLDNGIRAVYPGGESTWRWWAIGEIALANDCAYIYLTSTEARIIPARAFQTDEHFNNFVAKARELRDRNKGKSAT